MPVLVVRVGDPRTIPTAYLTDGARRHLYEVIDDSRGNLVLENCRTGFRMTVRRDAIAGYHLVRAAAATPDYPEPVNSD